jgi:type II secretory pathway component PulM
MNASAITAWYERQTPRDQRILLIGAGVVAVLLLAWLALLPQQAVSRAREGIASQQQLLDYMRQVGPALAAAGPGETVQPIGESFVVFIDRTAREHGLSESLTGSPPAGNGSFRVTFEGADFNLLLTWMHQLANRYGVRVEAANVTATAAPGRVNASVQLRPPA